jgi:hypothetical protein
MRFDEPDDVGEILGLAYVVKGHDEIDVPIASRFRAVGEFRKLPSSLQATGT